MFKAKKPREANKVYAKNYLKKPETSLKNNNALSTQIMIII